MNLIYIYIYESFTFWNKLQENAVFHDIKMFGDAPVYLFIFYSAVTDYKWHVENRIK